MTAQKSEALSNKCLEPNPQGLACLLELHHDGPHAAWHPAGFRTYWPQKLEMPWVTRK